MNDLDTDDRRQLLVLLVRVRSNLKRVVQDEVEAFCHPSNHS
jgi:hypothetical protein